MLKVRLEGKRDEMDVEAENWNERRSPRGEVEGRKYRLKGRSVLNHLSLLGCGLRAHSLFLRVVT